MFLGDATYEILRTTVGNLTERYMSIRDRNFNAPFAVKAHSFLHIIWGAIDDTKHVPCLVLLSCVRIRVRGNHIKFPEAYNEN